MTSNNLSERIEQNLKDLNEIGLTDITYNIAELLQIIRLQREALLTCEDEDYSSGYFISQGFNAKAVDAALQLTEPLVKLWEKPE